MGLRTEFADRSAESTDRLAEFTDVVVLFASFLFG